MQKHLFLFTGLLFFPLVVFGRGDVTVGSKNFPENYILAEVVAKIIEKTEDIHVDRKLGMGGTGLVYQALLNGDVDLYPEYTGTLSQAILKDPSLKKIDDIRSVLEKKGLVISDSLGFNNTYAFAVRPSVAKKRSLRKISDLKRHRDIKAAFSYEFMDRSDGFHALSERYGLKLKNVNRLEHALAYEAIKKGEVDLIDVYTTDAKLEKLDLVLLKDNKSFFPKYEGVILARKAFVEAYPDAWGAISKLAGTINNDLMTRLNAMADIEKRPFDEVADILLGSSQWVQLEKRKPVPDRELGTPVQEYFRMSSVYWKQIRKLTWEHLFLVFVSLSAAILVGIPFGLLSWSSKLLGHFFISVSEIVQTIPSLALLCFLIPFFGIGTVPALVALFLYSLLPIVRSTYVGLTSIDKKNIEVGQVLGLSSIEILKYIQLPMASIHILSGIKTSAIISVGTATLAALIGAGGYGTLIVTGLALNDIPMVLRGALPAALLAFLLHWLFDLLDILFVPKGLR